MFYDMPTLCRGDILAITCPPTTPLKSTLAQVFTLCFVYIIILVGIDVVVKTRIGFCPMYSNKQPQLPALLDLLVVVVFFFRFLISFCFACFTEVVYLPGSSRCRGNLGDGERQDFCSAHAFISIQDPQVSCLAILKKIKFSLTKLVCLANFIYVQSFSLGVFFCTFLDEIICFRFVLLCFSELFCLNDMTKKLLRLVHAASENKMSAELFQSARLFFTSFF
jgi:hypothetical protein